MTEELHRAMGRLEGKVDQMSETLTRIDARGDVFTKRLGRVENRQHWMSGASAVVGLIIGKFTGIFTFH